MLNTFKLFYLLFSCILFILKENFIYFTSFYYDAGNVAEWCSFGRNNVIGMEIYSKKVA